MDVIQDLSTPSMSLLLLDALKTRNALDFSMMPTVLFDPIRKSGSAETVMMDTSTTLILFSADPCLSKTAQTFSLAPLRTIGTTGGKCRTTKNLS
jgi:hypothetical protein